MLLVRGVTKLGMSDELNLRDTYKVEKQKPKTYAKAPMCKLEDDLISFTSRLRNKKVCFLSWSLKKVGLLTFKFPTDLGMSTLQIMLENHSLSLFLFFLQLI